MSRAKQRADRLRSELAIVQVLSDYGYNVSVGGGDREQQFSCDLHGSGRDVKPSARVYPASRSWYCFGCSKTRDVIQTAREKEGVDFWEAIRILEDRYHLPPLPWEDEGENLVKTMGDVVGPHLNSDRTLEEVRSRIDRLLQRMTDEQEVPMEQILACWEVFDRVCFGVSQEGWSEERGKSALLRLQERIPKPS